MIINYYTKDINYKYIGDISQYLKGMYISPSVWKQKIRCKRIMLMDEPVLSSSVSCGVQMLGAYELRRMRLFKTLLKKTQFR